MWRTARIAFLVLTSVGCTMADRDATYSLAEYSVVDPALQSSTSATPGYGGVGASLGVVGLVSGTRVSDDYRLAPLDVIDVSVFQVPDLNRTVQVGGTGVITLPLVGEVSAGGKTVRELEHEIAGLYEASYLQSPQVSVLVKEYVSQQIVVDGAVNSPGVYQIAGDATLLQAIAQAKGLTRTADPSGIMVFRTINGQRQAAVFDIRPIRQGTAPDPVLAGGDTIVADESGWRASWRNMRESIGVFGFFTALAL